MTDGHEDAGVSSGFVHNMKRLAGSKLCSGRITNTFGLRPFSLSLIAK